MATPKTAYFDASISLSSGLRSAFTRARPSVSDGAVSLAGYAPEYGRRRVMYGAPQRTTRIASSGSTQPYWCAGYHPTTGQAFRFCYDGTSGNLTLYTGNNWDSSTAIDITPTGGSPSKTGQVDLSFGTPDVDVNYVHTPVAMHAVDSGPCQGLVVIQCQYADNSGGWRVIGTSLWYWDWTSASTNKFRRIWPANAANLATGAANTVSTQVVASPGRSRGAVWSMMAHFPHPTDSNKVLLCPVDYVSQAPSTGMQMYLIEATPGSGGAFTFRRQMLVNITGTSGLHGHGGAFVRGTSGNMGYLTLNGDGIPQNQTGLIASISGTPSIDDFFGADPDVAFFTGTFTAALGTSSGNLVWYRIAGNGTDKGGMQAISPMPTDSALRIVVGADETCSQVFTYDWTANNVPGIPLSARLWGGPTSEVRTLLALSGQHCGYGAFYHTTPGTGRGPFDANMNAGIGFAFQGKIIASPLADRSAWGVLCRTGTQSASGLYWGPDSGGQRIVLGAPSSSEAVRSVAIPPYRLARGIQVGYGGGINYASTRTGGPPTVTGNQTLLGQVTGEPTNSANDAWTLAPIMADGNVQLLRISRPGAITGTFQGGETVTESVSGATGRFRLLRTIDGVNYVCLAKVNATPFTGGQTLTGGTSGATVTGGTATIERTTQALRTGGQQWICDAHSGHNNLGRRRIAVAAGGAVAGIVPSGEVRVGFAVKRIDPECRTFLRFEFRPDGSESGSAVICDAPSVDSDDEQWFWFEFNTATTTTPWTNPHGLAMQVKQSASGAYDQTFLLGCIGAWSGSSSADFPSRPSPTLGETITQPEASLLVEGWSPGTAWTFGCAGWVPESGPDRESRLRPTRYLGTLVQDEANYIRFSIDRINFTNATYTQAGRLLTDTEFGGTTPPTGGGFSHPGTGWDAVARVRGPATGIAATDTKEARIASVSGNVMTLDATTPAAFATDGAANLNGSIIGHDRIKAEFYVNGSLAATRWLQGSDYDTFDFGGNAPVLIALQCNNGAYTLAASVNGSTVATLTYSGTLIRPVRWTTGDAAGANVEAMDWAWAAMDESDSLTNTAADWVNMARTDWANRPASSSWQIRRLRGR